MNCGPLFPMTSETVREWHSGKVATGKIVQLRLTNDDNYVGPTCNHSSARTKTVRKKEREKEKISKAKQRELSLGPTGFEYDRARVKTTHACVCWHVCKSVCASRAQYMCVSDDRWDKVAETLGSLWDHRLTMFFPCSEWVTSALLYSQ